MLKAGHKQNRVQMVGPKSIIPQRIFLPENCRKADQMQPCVRITSILLSHIANISHEGKEGKAIIRMANPKMLKPEAIHSRHGSRLACKAASIIRKDMRKQINI